MSIVQYQMVEPTLTLGTGDTSLELSCHAYEISATVEVDEEGSTFCDPVGGEIWTITVQARQSFGANGLWTKIRALRAIDPKVAFVLETKTGTISVDFPVMSGVLSIPPVNFVDSGIAERSNIEIPFAVDPDPTFATAA